MLPIYCYILPKWSNDERLESRLKFYYCSLIIQQSVLWSWAMSKERFRLINFKKHGFSCFNTYNFLFRKVQSRWIHHPISPHKCALGFFQLGPSSLKELNTISSGFCWDLKSNKSWRVSVAWKSNFHYYTLSVWFL